MVNNIFGYAPAPSGYTLIFYTHRPQHSAPNSINSNDNDDVYTLMVDHLDMNIYVKRMNLLVPIAPFQSVAGRLV